MKKPPFTRRFAAAAAIATVAVTGVAVQVAPANASTVYWTFKNRQTGKCLTHGSSSVWATSCVSGADSQQWDWWPSNYDGSSLLRAKGTTLCLRTDRKSSKNAMWLSDCDANAQGELFQYQYSTQAFITSDYYYVTMDPDSSEGVYPESPTPSGFYSYWYGTHT